MKAKHKLYFICEDGHLTVGDHIRTKCDFEIIDIENEKNKKGKFVPVEKRKRPCGKKILDTHKIPEELKFTDVWDYTVMRAFLIDQNPNADLIISIQKAITGLWETFHESTNTGR